LLATSKAHILEDVTGAISAEVGVGLAKLTGRL
jgi:hypothetical protein